MAMTKKEKAAADMKYAHENLKRIALDYRINEYNAIVEAAKKSGETVSAFCKDAIMQKVGYNKSDFPRKPKRKKSEINNSVPEN